MGYFAGDFPDTFNVGQSSSHATIESGKLPVGWYGYFAAIVVWTLVGVYVQYQRAYRNKPCDSDKPKDDRDGYQYAPM